MKSGVTLRSDDYILQERCQNIIINISLQVIELIRYNLNCDMYALYTVYINDAERGIQ